MTGAIKNGEDFLGRLTEIIIANLQNDPFGIDDLAREMGMSRSNLHRQLKKRKNISPSLYIRTVRLEKAMVLLSETERTASEVAYDVGFSSPAYFNHCFHEHYGFPPGEVKKRLLSEEEKPVESTTISKHLKTTPFNGKKSAKKKQILPLMVILIVVALTWSAIYLFSEKELSTNILRSNSQELSVVVLPFKNFSDDEHNQYFADGIMEDILNNLFRITTLRVVSRTSAEHFRTSSLTAREIAKQLKVNYVLEGSVRRYGDQTRITIQLIDARLDKHLWSSSFDRELDDVIGIQSEIALQVANRMNVVISKSEIEKIEKISTQNPEAYDHYLRARFLLHKANSAQRADFEKAGVINCLSYYEKAIAADSSFAEAWAGLANAWFNLSAWRFLPAYEGFPKAHTYSLQAIDLDPDCAEAHAVLGALFIWGGLDNRVEGGKELKKALELNPNFSTAHQWYAQFLMITGPIEEARIHVNRAKELEPYFWVVQTLSAWIYYFEKKYDQAIEDCKIARALNPGFIDNDWLFVLNYAKLDEGEKMLQELQSIIKKHTRDEKYLEGVQAAYHKNGINGIFAWLDDVNQNRPLPVEGMDGHPFYSAWWKAISGNNDEAVYWLERTLEDPRPLGHYTNLIAINPDFDGLRDDPRFLAILEKLELISYNKRQVK